MHIVIYQFTVKEDHHEEFINSWKDLTQLIYQFEGSLGSRLHKKDKNTFIAYAQWPSKEIFDNSGYKLPESADSIRETMRSTCNQITRMMELEPVEDLLKDKIFK